MVVVTPVWGNNVFFRPKDPIKIFHIQVSQCSEENPVLKPPPPSVTYLCCAYKPPFCIEVFMLNETISYCGVPIWHHPTRWWCVVAWQPMNHLEMKSAG